MLSYKFHLTYFKKETSKSKNKVCIFLTMYS